MSTLIIPDRSYQDFAEEFLFGIKRYSDFTVLSFDELHNIPEDEGIVVIYDPMNQFSPDLEFKNMPRFARIIYFGDQTYSQESNYKKGIYVCPLNDFTVNTLAENYNRITRNGQFRTFLNR